MSLEPMFKDAVSHIGAGKHHRKKRPFFLFFFRIRFWCLDLGKRSPSTPFLKIFQILDCTGPWNPWKTLNLEIAFSRPGKSWNFSSILQKPLIFEVVTWPDNVKGISWQLSMAQQNSLLTAFWALFISSMLASTSGWPQAIGYWTQWA